MQSDTRVFAKLLPYNTQAKLAFNAVHADNLKGLLQPPPLNMDVSHEQIYDEGVCLDVIGTKDIPERPGWIWKGCYTFNFDVLPTNPKLGWTAGVEIEGRPADLLLTTERMTGGAKDLQAVFNFHPLTGLLYIGSEAPDKASAPAIKVNSQVVHPAQRHTLNNNEMRVSIGQLEYTFSYTQAVRNSAYIENRKAYMEVYLGWKNKNFSRTPTPAVKKRKIKEWVLSDFLGKGASGRVWSATNANSKVVAIKIVVVKKGHQAAVNDEIANWRTLTRLARHKKVEDRLVHLVDAFSKPIEEFWQPPIKDEFFFVLEPAALRTFDSLIEDLRNQKGPPIEDKDSKSEKELSQLQVTFDGVMDDPMRLLYDALLGVNFMHKNGWLHGDLKPGNIGVRGTGEAVLLDLGGATWVPAGTSLKPKIGGTPGYLSPERDLEQLDASADIWSMGLVAFQLLYDDHPWRMYREGNPWRHPRLYEPKDKVLELRKQFHGFYDKAVRTIQDSEAMKSSEVGNLLLGMLRFKWAEVNQGKRLDIEAVVNHAFWKPLAWSLEQELRISVPWLIRVGLRRRKTRREGLVVV